MMRTARSSRASVRVVASFVAQFVALVIALAPAHAGQAPPLRTHRQAAPAVRVAAVESVGMTVADADRSIAFYTEQLGFRVVGDVELAGAPWEALRGVFPVRMRVVRLQLGAEVLELTQYLAPEGRPAPVDGRSNDRWFQHVAIVVRDMDAAYRRLHDAHVRQISSEPQRLPDWNPNAGGIRAFYFRDPDGHPLELIWFPPGKGDARWQAPGDGLFLGIDHTAIAVAETATSLRFYVGRLGLRVVGRSENWGIEQERLNGVAGSRVRITSLRAAAGPGVEFLEYVRPRNGRVDRRTAANDLVHWRTRMALEAGLGDGPQPVEIPDRGLGFSRGRSVRDPDGHTLELVER